jgi:hypothetical protein
VIKLWLDDIREMPKGFDYWARTAQDAIRVIKSGEVSYISFDHDLGPLDADNRNKNNGYEVAKYIEMLAYNKAVKPIVWEIHSQNPVGRERIEVAMMYAMLYWEKEK